MKFYTNWITAMLLTALLSIGSLVNANDTERSFEKFSYGAVYAMTNSLDNNEIVAYDRAPDGTLTFEGRYATGGSGIGNATEPLDALGSQNPLILSENERWLFAVNAGSNEISIFRVRRVGLFLIDKVPSGGLFPASLTIHSNILYVLNAGGDANITGFRITDQGRLIQISNSTRTLNVGGTNPPFFLVSPAQIGFDSHGDVLAVTIKGSNEIQVFSVNRKGRPSAEPVTTISHGRTPFGFTFDRNNHLLVTEAFGNGEVGDPNASAVSSYNLSIDGQLNLISASVGNRQTASCWIANKRSCRYTYVTNNASNTITGYRIRRSGRLLLLNANGVTARTEAAPVDLAMSRYGDFLYNVNAGTGTVSMFRIEDDGSLSSLGSIAGLPASDGAVGIVAR